MAKIAVALEQAVANRALHGAGATPSIRLLASGQGWTVHDAICTAGPQDRPFEEQHTHVAIAVVAAGSFQYRSTGGRELMTPGSLFLGNPGQAFECAHDHSTGDRCVAFRFTRDYFEELAAGGGARAGALAFPAIRVPPVRALSPLVAQACAGLSRGAHLSWEELSVQLAARALQVSAGFSSAPDAVPPSAVARVTRVLRHIERHADTDLTLRGLAREAGLSAYHFLRTFERLTGVTPHQYLLRARLRHAAMRLALEPDRILDVALDSGFGDVSNFNRAFRAEFGTSPRSYRRALVTSYSP